MTMGVINPRSGIGAVPPRNSRNRDPFIVCLGRHGDIINILPLAVKLTRDGKPIKWVVNREFAPTLEGCSYVEPIIVDAGYSKPNGAASIAQSMGLHGKAIIAQSYGAVVERQRKHKSYQIESWEVAHYAHEFGYWPTVFDKRSPEREADLFSLFDDGKPVVLVSTSSISSPIPHLADLPGKIQEALGDNFTVIDTSQVKAERIYDMLGLMDRAKLLVTVDSALLHLARASKCPVIAITNEKWFGSVPPHSTIKEFKYGNAYPNVITDAVKSFLIDSKPNPVIFHAVDGWGGTERHAEAKAVNLTRNLIRVERTEYQRDARSIGEARALPYLKDILEPALNMAGQDDIIVWANNDIILGEGIERWAIDHVGFYGAATMRRSDNHAGRDVMGFTGKWLRENWNQIPDFILGGPIFDLAMAALIRQGHGWKSTMFTMGFDLFPSETKDRLITHRDHEAVWTNESPSAIHNGKEFANWLSKYGNMSWRQ